MPSVIYKPFMLSVVMLNVVMLSVIAPLKATHMTKPFLLFAYTLTKLECCFFETFLPKSNVCVLNV
jgi:hypothetical protein